MKQRLSYIALVSAVLQYIPALKVQSLYQVLHQFFLNFYPRKYVSSWNIIGIVEEIQEHLGKQVVAQDALHKLLSAPILNLINLIAPEKSPRKSIFNIIKSLNSYSLWMNRYILILLTSKLVHMAANLKQSMNLLIQLESSKKSIVNNMYLKKLEIPTAYRFFSKKPIRKPQ